MYQSFTLATAWLAGSCGRERRVPHIASLGKDPKSKFKVWFVYHFCTVVKSKNLKSSHPKPGTFCSISGVAPRRRRLLYAALNSGFEIPRCQVWGHQGFYSSEREHPSCPGENWGSANRCLKWVKQETEAKGQQSNTSSVMTWLPFWLPPLIYPS